MGINKECGATSKIADPKEVSQNRTNKENRATKVTREAESEEEGTQLGDITLSTAGEISVYKYIHLIKV